MMRFVSRESERARATDPPVARLLAPRVLAELLDVEAARAVRAVAVAAREVARACEGRVEGREGLSFIPDAAREVEPAPMFQKMSPPPSRWKREMPPSPVLCANPPSAAPRLSAATAEPESAP